MKKSSFGSSFNFINDNGGFVDTRIYVLLASAGVGKTTLLRALLDDCTKTKKVLYVSTEEDMDDVVEMFDKAGYDTNSENFSYLCEKEFRWKHTDLTLDDYFHWLSTSMVEANADILFFDNLSTTPMYVATNRSSDQVKFYEEFRKLAWRIRKPIFLVTHTSAKSISNSNTMTCAEDIAFSKHCARTAEYVFALSGIYVENNYSESKKYTFIQIVKSRFHEPGGIYMLNYSQYKKSYTSDVLMPRSEFKELYKNREKFK